MDTVVFGNITVLHLIIVVVALIVLSMLVDRLRKLFVKDTLDENLQRVVCRSCGWQGRVSRIAGRCPKCNEPLGDRTAGGG
jgi:hypothetical protein